MTLTHDDTPAPTVPDAPSGAPVRSGRRARSHARARYRRFVRPSLRWRILVATLGALLLVVCSGMALGVVTLSPSGLDFDFGGAPQSPPVVTGTDGVQPGGAPQNVSLTVQNPAASAFEITAVLADLQGLPSSCPASAWQVGVPALLPTVPARAEVTVPLPVTLRSEAPDSCQGVTVRFPVQLDGLRHPRPEPSPATSVAGAGTDEATGPGTDVAGRAAAPVSPAPAAGSAAASLRPDHLTATATITAARLGTPRGTLTVRGNRVEVVPVRPAAGPVPAGYDVDVLGEGTRRTSVCRGAVASCLDTGVPLAAERRYLVTARVGTHWVRPSPPLTTWTPPPSPTLAFADGDRPAASALVLHAGAAASDYDVQITSDGRVFANVRVFAGRGVDRTLEAPALPAGPHRLAAVARFHGWRAPSGTLRFTVSGEGVVAPGPSEAPAPVSSDPAPSATGVDPVTVAPSTTTAAPTRPAPSVTDRRQVVQRPAAPPVVEIVDPTDTTTAADPDPLVPDAVPPGPPSGGQGGSPAPPTPTVASDPE